MKKIMKNGNKVEYCEEKGETMHFKMQNQNYQHNLIPEIKKCKMGIKK